jgi:hypothetical protein
MERLSSCYFCGTALDASLEEYPVVPESLRPGAETGKTVVLCETCRHKLDAVTDAVVETVEARADGPATDESPDDHSLADGESESADADSGEAGSGSATDIESTLGDDDLLESVGDSGSNGEQGRPEDDPVEASEMQFGDDRDDGSGASGNAGGGVSEDDEKERKYTSSRRAGYTRDDEPNTAPRDADSDADESDESSADEDGDADADERTDADEPASDEGASAEEAPSEDGSDDGADEDGPERDVTLTRLENTKVMRLLQNREFPVERDGFVTVASSAYEVAPSDCSKVIDLAIEHDLLDEDEGQLRPGPNWG